MVDPASGNGKKTDMGTGFMLVVAGALLGPGGRWLVQRRPEGKHHAGLWEFPGGKVEQSETPVIALIRELSEELGVSIRVEDCFPAGFAEERTHDDRQPIVILLYKVTSWDGEPAALEGGELQWCNEAELSEIEKPPLDEELAEQLLAIR